MPDLHDLDGFDEGLPVHPLPPTEVRRRGDRLRRRNSVLATVGGVVAAVLVIGTPVAVLAGRDGTDASPPVATRSPSADTTDAAATEWRRTIPPDFPVETGFLPADLIADVPITQAPGLDEIAVCGTTAWSVSTPAPALDTVGVRYAPPAGDGFAGRTLALYPDAATATEVLQAIEAAVTSCPLDPNGTGFEQRYTVETSDYGDRSLVFTQASVDEDGVPVGELGVTQVVRVGNALLLSATAGSGGADRAAIETETARVAADSASTITSMCVFAADPCDPGSVVPAPDPTPDLAGVPADFPLDVGLEAMTVDGGEKTGPATDTPGVVLPERFCGADLWPAPGVTSRLATTVSGPEYFEARELVAFATAQEAVDAVAALRQSVTQCPVVAGDTPAGDTLYVSHDTDTGYDAATFSYTFRAGTGGEVFQFVRVGRAVLASVVAGEYSPGDASGGAELLTEDNRVLTSQLCAFTEAGC